ncbi:MAG TPA: Holliday junction resolvase RuvX [Acidimicrobiales bacterium]|nr:Holliday junction resolvase RuvX [Acidimicrobiales bacterium]
MRVLGVDLGERRIGVAVSDSAEVLASPYTTLSRTGDAEADRAALVAVVDEVGAGRVVVGLPLGLDGRTGRAARGALEEADALRQALGERAVEVVTVDERLTTVTAERALREGGRHGRDRRKVVDQSAAAVLLQAWLDGHRSAP